MIDSRLRAQVVIVVLAALRSVEDRMVPQRQCAVKDISAQFRGRDP